LVAVCVTGGWMLWERINTRITAMNSPLASYCGDTISTKPSQQDETSSSEPALVCTGGTDIEGKGQNLTASAAADAIHRYLRESNLSAFTVDRLLEFTDYYYAVLREPVTGKGAMEILVDRKNGAVEVEIGPNLMWNTKYGLHRDEGMTGVRDLQAHDISAKQARSLAMDWLQVHHPGLSVDNDIIQFYGYYSLYIIDGSSLVGILSVHDTTGQVWYHTWHGAYVAGGK
jgi:hypothetical protein